MTVIVRHEMMTHVVHRDDSGTHEQATPSSQARRVETLFAVLADDGFGWHQIGQLHADARMACRTVALYVHLLRPELDLGELETLAATAVSSPETGTASMTVIDDRHRIDRIESVPDLGSGVTYWR